MFAKGTIHIIILTYILSFLTLILKIFIFDSTILWFPILLFLIGGFVSLFFFRDPERLPNKGIIAPADGKITSISEDGNFIKIITFMNVHDVHVNRMPMNGKIIELHHFQGKHMPAFFKDSERNERVMIEIESEIGIIKIVQIAGIFARRIVPYIKKGDIIKKGDKIGIIKFGSRVDLFLPNNKVKIVVKLGERVRANETTFGIIQNMD